MKSYKKYIIDLIKYSEKRKQIKNYCYLPTDTGYAIHVTIHENKVLYIIRNRRHFEISLTEDGTTSMSFGGTMHRGTRFIIAILLTVLVQSYWDKVKFLIHSIRVIR